MDVSSYRCGNINLQNAFSGLIVNYTYTLQGAPVKPGAPFYFKGLSVFSTCLSKI